MRRFYLAAWSSLNANVFMQAEEEALLSYGKAFWDHMESERRNRAHTLVCRLTCSAASVSQLWYCMRAHMCAVPSFLHLEPACCFSQSPAICKMHTFASAASLPCIGQA